VDPLTLQRATAEDVGVTTPSSNAAKATIKKRRGRAKGTPNWTRQESLHMLSIALTQMPMTNQAWERVAIIHCHRYSKSAFAFFTLMIYLQLRLFQPKRARFTAAVNLPERDTKVARI